MRTTEKVLSVSFLTLLHLRPLTFADNHASGQCQTRGWNELESVGACSYDAITTGIAGHKHPFAIGVTDPKFASAAFAVSQLSDRKVVRAQDIDDAVSISGDSHPTSEISGLIADKDDSSMRIAALAYSSDQLTGARKE